MLFFVLLSFILRDKPDKRLPCLHEQTFVGHRRWMSSGHPLSADRSRAETSEQQCCELPAVSRRIGEEKLPYPIRFAIRKYEREDYNGPEIL